MNPYKPSSRHYSAISQRPRVASWRTGVVLLGIMLIGFSSPLACLLNCWLLGAPVSVNAAINQTSFPLAYKIPYGAINYATETPAYNATTQSPVQKTEDCAFCRAHEASSLLVEVALLAATPLMIVLLVIPLLRATPLLLCLIVYAPPRRPPRPLAV